MEPKRKMHPEKPAPRDYNGYITRVTNSYGYNAYQATLISSLKDDDSIRPKDDRRPVYAEINPKQWKVAHPFRCRNDSTPPWRHSDSRSGFHSSPRKYPSRLRRWMYPDNRKIFLDEDRYTRNGWDGKPSATRPISFKSQAVNSKTDESDSKEKISESDDATNNVGFEEPKKMSSSRPRKEKSVNLEEGDATDHDNQALFDRRRYREQEANWPEIYCTTDEKDITDLMRQGILEDAIDPTIGDITLDDISQLHDDAEYTVKWKPPKRRGTFDDKRTDQPEPVVLLSNMFSDEELAMLVESSPDLDWILISEDTASTSGSWIELEQEGHVATDGER